MDKLEDTLPLGGNIVLSGFRQVDGSSMVIIKKMVGNHANRLMDNSESFEKLHLHMKPVHSTVQPRQFEIHAKMMDHGQVYASEAVERNIFVAIDSALKKLQRKR